MWVLGDWELDEEHRELRRGTERVPTSRRSFEILLHLARCAPRIVTPEELSIAVWNSANVGKATLGKALSRVRAVLGDAAARHLVTVRGQGYRLADCSERRADEAQPWRAGSALEPPRARVVGREAELALLRQILADCKLGRGALCVLAGEPGIGKTHLAAAVAEIAGDEGLRVAWAACAKRDGDSALSPWDLVKRQLFGSSYAAGMEAAPASSVLAGRGGYAAAVARRRFFDECSSLLREAAAYGALLIVFDDLHFASSLVLELLATVARELAALPVCILVTMRPPGSSEGSPASAGFLEAVLERGRWLDLVPLSKQGVSELMQQSMGKAPEAAVLARVFETTGGNPLFVSELARFVGTEPEQSSALGGLGLPHNVRAAIDAHVAPLHGATLHCLWAAAVIGVEFDVELLAEIADIADAGLASIAAVESALGTARAARVITCNLAFSQCRFTHTLMRDVLYEACDRRLRATLHRAVADAVARRAGTSQVRVLSRVAHHVWHALEGAQESSSRAVACFAAAAEEAMGELAYEEAAKWLERAGAVAARAGYSARARLDLMLRQGEALRRAGAVDRGKATFLAASELAVKLDDSVKLAAAALGYAHTHCEDGSVNYLAVDLLRQALQQVVDSGLRVRLLAYLAISLMYVADPSERVEVQAEALALAQNQADPELVVEALRARLFALWGLPGAALREQWLSAIKALETAARATGDIEAQLEAVMFEATVHLEHAEAARMHDAIRRHAQLARHARHAKHEYVALENRAMLELLEGHFEVAQRAAAEALAHGRRSKISVAEDVFGAQMLVVGRAVNAIDAALAQAEEALHRQPGSFTWRVGRALLLVDKGQLASARAEFERFALNDFADTPRDPTWLPVTCGIAEVCIAIADRSRAKLLYEVLEPFCDRVACIGTIAVCWGPVSFWLAGLAELTGNWRAACEHLETALELAIRLSARLWIARVQTARARLLSRSDNPSADQRVAARIAEEARALARELAG